MSLLTGDLSRRIVRKIHTKENFLAKLDNGLTLNSYKNINSITFHFLVLLLDDFSWT